MASETRSPAALRFHVQQCATSHLRVLRLSAIGAQQGGFLAGETEKIRAAEEFGNPVVSVLIREMSHAEGHPITCR